MIIAIEGVDGVGKGTQSNLLYNKFIERGYTASLTSFPVYTSFFGKMVGEYLNGSYGELKDIHPKLIANLYAFDRWLYFQKQPQNTCHFSVIDRYVPSNYAHQASKFENNSEISHMIEWIRELEHEVLGQPQADLVLVLDAPIQLTSAQVLKKSKRNYTALKTDLHEADNSYLEKVRTVFLDLCKRQNNYKLICCNVDLEMRSVEDIANEVWETVSTRFSL